MPLRALLTDGTDVIAPLLTASEWEMLRRDSREGRRRLLLPCCGSIAYQRTSPLGLRHFFHPPASRCVHSGETQAHLLGKEEIVQACRQSGYTPRTEWAENAWRADVLATKGDIRIAFEVQLGCLPLDELLVRQRRYQQSGVRGCWFCLQPPDELRASGVTGDLIARPDLPLFEIEPDLQHAFTVHLNGRRYPLPEIVAALLGGRIAFRESTTVRVERSIAVGFYRIRCWRCAAEVAVYHVLSWTNQGRTECGARLYWTERAAATPRDEGVAELRPAVRSAIRSAIQADRNLAGRLALIRKRSRRPEQIGPSWCFGCPHCGASFTSLQLRRRPDAVAMDAASGSQPSPLQWPHWCYGDGGSFCSGNTVMSVRAGPWAG